MRGAKSKSATQLRVGRWVREGSRSRLGCHRDLKPREVADRSIVLHSVAIGGREDPQVCARMRRLHSSADLSLCPPLPRRALGRTVADLLGRPQLSTASASATAHPLCHSMMVRGPRISQDASRRAVLRVGRAPGPASFRLRSVPSLLAHLPTLTQGGKTAVGLSPPPPSIRPAPPLCQVRRTSWSFRRNRPKLDIDSGPTLSGLFGAQIRPSFER